MSVLFHHVDQKDAFVSDIIITLRAIQHSDEPELESLKPVVHECLYRLGHDVDSFDSMLSLSQFLITANKESLLEDMEYSPQFIDGVFDSLPDALRDAEGFDIKTSQGLAHFAQAIAYMAENIDSSPKISPEHTHALTALSQQLTLAALTFDPEFKDRPSLSEVALSLASVLTHDRQKNKFHSESLLEYMPYFESTINDLKDPSKQEQAFGIDVLFSIYKFAVSQNNTGAIPPLPERYRMYYQSNDPFVSIHDHYDTDRIRRPEAADAFNVARLLQTIIDTYRLTPLENYHQFTSMVTECRSRLLDDISSRLNNRLSPDKNYKNAMTEWEFSHKKDHLLYFIAKDDETLHQLISEIRKAQHPLHVVVNRFSRDERGTVFTDSDNAHAYMFHFNDELNQQHSMVEWPCTAKDIQSILASNIWPLEVLKTQITEHTKNAKVATTPPAPLLTLDALTQSNAIIDETKTFSECHRNDAKKNPGSVIAYALRMALKYQRDGHIMSARKDWDVKTGNPAFDLKTPMIIHGDANDATYIARRIHSRTSSTGKQSADLFSFGNKEFKEFGQWVVDTIKTMPRAETEPMQAHLFFTRTENGEKRPFGAIITDTERRVVDHIAGPEPKKIQAIQNLCDHLSRSTDSNPHWAGAVVDGKIYVAIPELAALLAEANIQSTVGYPNVKPVAVTPEQRLQATFDIAKESKIYIPDALKPMLSDILTANPDKWSVLVPMALSRADDRTKMDILEEMWAGGPVHKERVEETNTNRAVPINTNNSISPSINATAPKRR